MQLPTKTNLALAEKVKLQQLLSHYLKTYEIEYRHCHHTSAPAVSQLMASYLGISLARYYEVRGSSKATPKLITAITYLQQLASLRGLPLSGFVSYLTDEHPRFDAAGKPLGPLEHWENEILTAFDSISSQTRKRFVALCMHHTKPQTLEHLLSLICQLADFDLDTLQALVDLLTRILPKPAATEPTTPPC